jgi:hypothetical protein
LNRRLTSSDPWPPVMAMRNGNDDETREGAQADEIIGP